MLTSSIRSISDFSSAAGDVRLQIARARDGRAQPLTEAEREGLRTIRDLVDLGDRYTGSPPNDNLDVSGSTPEQIDLAGSLKGLIPGGVTEIPLWTQKAAGILNKLEHGASWDELGQADQGFVEDALEPFLKNLLGQEPQEPQE